ncbi:MAG: hypothetical protein CBB77_10875 [Hyphomonas sp. TMED17]|nr:MAG: hypothetical protein CBB77_10875 [Hyphomonas sp. TMED17]
MGDGSPAEGLVEDVLRDARSLLGEAVSPENAADLVADSTVDRSKIDAAGLLSDLDRPTDDLAAELQPSPTGTRSDDALPGDGIKRGPAARDLGPEGPQADLFGMASPSEALSSPGPPTVEEIDSAETPALIESEHAATSPESASPAAALEALMAIRIAEESEAEPSISSILETPSSSPNPSEIARAEAAERSAAATLDAMGGNAPLRSTAGEVEAVSSGDPLDRMDAGTVRSEISSVESVPPVLTGPTGPRSEPLEAEVDLGPDGASGDTSDPPMEASEVDDQSVSIEATPDPDASMLVDSPPMPSSMTTPSGIKRIAALPFRLLPSSMHGVVSVAAISLAFWVPVAWTYAVLGPEAFERLLPSATTPSEPLDPAESDSPGVDPSATADPPSTS